jgi:hypothetical protein
MGALVFDNQVFDSWLTKFDRERITTEGMLVLILKAQANHFHHMDLEFREEFKSIDTKFEKVYDFFKWQGGILLALFAGLYLKLFLS